MEYDAMGELTLFLKLPLTSACATINSVFSTKVHKAAEKAIQDEWIEDGEVDSQANTYFKNSQSLHNLYRNLARRTAVFIVLALRTEHMVTQEHLGLHCFHLSNSAECLVCHNQKDETLKSILLKCSPTSHKRKEIKILISVNGDMNKILKNKSLCIPFLIKC